jgi:hypothetical protein
MYTALFNGGRMIRNELLATPSAFWQCLKTPSNFEQRAHLILSKRLQFWDFGDGKDGDDVKEDFKKRFEIAASWLKSCRKDCPTAKVLPRPKQQLCIQNGTRAHYLNYLQREEGEAGKRSAGNRIG